MGGLVTHQELVLEEKRRAVAVRDAQGAPIPEIEKQREKERGRESAGQCNFPIYSSHNQHH